MKTERRFLSAATCPVQLRAEGDGKPTMITGYGSVFYDGTEATEYVLWDTPFERCVERIMPTAFDKPLADKADVRGLFNHEPCQILGRTAAGTMTLAKDAKGLKYEITPGTTSCARDVTEHLKRGDVTGSSFSFYPIEERWIETKDEQGKWHTVREVRSVELFDCGPVTFPAYTSSTASVRSAADTDEARRSLETYRKAQEQQQSALKGKLAAYAARARAAEVE